MEERKNVDNLRITLFPNKGVSALKKGIKEISFILGTNINEYKSLEYEFTPKEIKEDGYGGADCYSFLEYSVIVWTDDDTGCDVDLIKCECSCLWEGKELIGMDYDVFLDLFQLSPDNYDRIYSDGPKINGRIYDVYDFDKLGLMVWVWRKRIRCILISKYNPDDEIPFDKK